MVLIIKFSTGYLMSFLNLEDHDHRIEKFKFKTVLVSYYFNLINWEQIAMGNNQGGFHKRERTNDGSQRSGFRFSGQSLPSGSSLPDDEYVACFSFLFYFENFLDVQYRLLFFH